jgi:methanogenic corrinoid protein MtbC1
MSAILNDISEALQAGKAKDVKALIEQALADKIGAKAILEEGLLPGMSIIGDKFKNNEVYVPEVLISARAMKAGTDILKPYLVAEKVEPLGKICIGTVKGDLHDIGKNLVKMMMEGKGIEVVDLGVDVSPEQFLAAVKDQGCQIVCCSALLTTTMGVMKDIVDIFVNEGIRDKVKIMIGGAPITDAYCASIGADGYTADAASASDLAVEFLK